MNFSAFHWLLTGLSTAALSLSIAALALAWQKLKLPRGLRTDFALLQGDIEHDLASIRSSIKRLNARVGMREAREKKETDDNGDATASSDEWKQRPGETPDDWKRRIRMGPLRAGRRPE